MKHAEKILPPSGDSKNPLLPALGPVCALRYGACLKQRYPFEGRTAYLSKAKISAREGGLMKKTMKQNDEHF
jgi:hypothetical protein